MNKGELQAQSYSSYICNQSGLPAYAPTYQQGANGFMASDEQTCDAPGHWTLGGNGWDYLTGAATGNSDDDGTDTTQYVFDKAARQTSANQTWQWSTTCGQEICYHDGTGSLAKTYDAENHLLSESVSTWDIVAASLSAVWKPPRNLQSLRTKVSV